MATEPLDLGRWSSPPTIERWHELAKKTLKGRDPAILERDLGGVRISALETAGASARTVGGRRGRWQVRQELGGTRIKAAARQASEDLELGGDAPWIRIDRSSRLGVRPDEAREPGGASGLTVLTHHDLGGLLRRVDLARVPVVLEAGANGLALLGALLAVADDRKVSPDRLSGAVHADPLGTLARDGVLPRGVDAAYDDVAAMLRSDHRVPGLRLVAVSALPAAEAGAAAATELAFALASLVETLRRLEARDIDAERVLVATEVLVGLDANVVLGVAKLRALRTLWARLGAAAGVSLAGRQPRVHARMNDAVMARRDPWSNLLRATLAGFAGAAGGADALTLLPYDAALGESDDQARRIARNLHLLLHDESHLARHDDPALGAYAVEQLTDALCRQAWAHFQAIEVGGGLLQGLADGSVAERIAADAERTAHQVATRAHPIVGVSVYASTDERAPQRSRPDPVRRDRDLKTRWSAVTLALGQRPDDPDLNRALDALRTGTDSRVRPATLAASRGVHLATIAGAVPGMPFTAAALAPVRLAASWEALRDRVEPSATSIFLANLGPRPAHKARAGFARDLFRAAGFRICDTDGFDDPDTAASAFGVSGCSAACICGTDDAYERLAPTLATQLRAAGARFVLVAGRWPSDPTAWRDAGIDDVVHVGADVLRTMQTLADGLALGTGEVQ